MCGIALVIGTRPDPHLFDRMLAAIEPRGDVTETLTDERMLCGTQRLRIVDRERAVQPWVSADGRWALCYNGEVFNYHELHTELVKLGHEFRSESDTEVVLEAFLEWGDSAVHHLRGEFAFTVVERPTGRAYLARDPVGVKPLYWSRAAGRLHIASEVKALVPVGAGIAEVPPGHHGWSDNLADEPHLSPYVDLLALGDDEEQLTDPDEAMALVRAALVDSIRVRVDTDLTVGVILSGGLDSTLTLLHVRQMHPDCIAFTVGSEDGEDLRYARRLTQELGVRHEVVELRPSDIRLADVREAVRVSELTEYGDLINAVVSAPLFERIHRCGVKVVLSGDGSDELFGGYDMYKQIGDDLRQRLFQHKLRNLARTELQRVDRMSMGNGVETRIPFLDLALVKLAMRVPIDLKVHGDVEKWILRQAFKDVVPGYVLGRPKNPMSHSSGLHEWVRLYKPFFSRTYRSFHYDLLEPMRRDFSIVLEQHDLDLDRALAGAAHRVDYTVAEHARDLVGAVRWNLTSAARKATRHIR